MGISNNISAVRTDVGTHAQNFFVYFLKKYPQHQESFPDYKGKNPDSLKSTPKFASHSKKVVALLLDISEDAGNDRKLSEYAQRLVNMSQHSGLSLGAFKDMLCALIGYLQQTLGGSCDVSGWEGVAKSIISALQVAGM